MSSHPAAEHPSPVTPQTEAGRRLLKLGQKNAWPYDYPETILAIEREAADAARKEVVDEIRTNMPAAVLATDGGPAVAYAMRVIAYLDSLARPVKEEK